MAVCARVVCCVFVIVCECCVFEWWELAWLVRWLVSAELACCCGVCGVLVYVISVSVCVCVRDVELDVGLLFGAILAVWLVCWLAAVVERSIACQLSWVVWSVQLRQYGSQVSQVSQSVKCGSGSGSAGSECSLEMRERLVIHSRAMLAGVRLFHQLILLCMRIMWQCT